MDPVRHLEARGLQHRRPEQRVEVDDVLADEVDDPRVRVLRPVVERVLRPARLLRPPLGGGDVADGRVQPDVEELVLFPRDGEPEVRPVPADVPVVEPLLEELAQLRGDAGVQEGRLPDEVLQEVCVAREPEEQVGGPPAHRRRAAQPAAWVLQIRGRVGLAALLADVAVLVGSVAVGAAATDEAVRQKARVLLAVRLLHVPPVDVACLLEAAVDQLRVVAVLLRVGGPEEVEGDVEVPEVLLVLLEELGHERVGRHPVLARVQLDGRPVRVVRAQVDGVLAAGLEEARVDVGLHVLHEVPQMDGAVRVRQGAGDEDALGHGGRRLLRRARTITMGTRRVSGSDGPASRAAAPRG